MSELLANISAGRVVSERDGVGHNGKTGLDELGKLHSRIKS